VEMRVLFLRRYPDRPNQATIPPLKPVSQARQAAAVFSV
jgi:hypothetical protein